MKRIVVLSFAALAGLTPLASGAGQRVAVSVTSLQRGDTVRLWAPAARLARAVGVIAELGEDTVVLRAQPRRSRSFSEAPIPLRAVTRLEVQRGTYRSAGRTVIGIVGGLVGGLVLGSFAGVTLECGTSCSDEQNEFAGLAGFVVGGALGALAGGITGGVWGARRRPRWQPVVLGAR
jgi:hypothetical protein